MDKLVFSKIETNLKRIITITKMQWNPSSDWNSSEWKEVINAWYDIAYVSMFLHHDCRCLECVLKWLRLIESGKIHNRSEIKRIRWDTILDRTESFLVLLDRALSQGNIYENGAITDRCWYEPSEAVERFEGKEAMKIKRRESQIQFRKSIYGMLRSHERLDLVAHYWFPRLEMVYKLKII